MNRSRVIILAVAAICGLGLGLALRRSPDGPGADRVAGENGGRARRVRGG